MSTIRTAGRRLRVESLEGREVPSAVNGTDPNAGNPTVTGQSATDTGTATPAVVTTTDTGATTTVTTMSTVTSTAAPTTTPASPTVDLAATATVDHLKPSLGDIVTLKVTIANNGLVQATGVTTAVTLPAGLTFVSSDAPAGNFDATAGSWVAGTIAAKASTVLTIKAKVTDTATQPVAASISHADQPDDNTQNNAASATVTPVLAKLNLMKAVSTASAAVGSTVVMAVAVGNAGPGKARHVVVADTLGSGLTFVKALSATQGSYDPATHTWSVGMVAPGTIAVLRVLVVVGKTGRIDSPATMTATGFDTTTSNLNATAAITGTKLIGPPGWAYFAGPGFLAGPTAVPIQARGSTPTIATGSLLSAEFLMSHGFSVSGQKLV